MIGSLDLPLKFPFTIDQMGNVAASLREFGPDLPQLGVELTAFAAKLAQGARPFPAKADDILQPQLKTVMVDG